MVLSLKKLNLTRQTGQVKFRMIASYQEMCLEMGDTGHPPTSLSVVWSRGGRREASQPVNWKPTMRIYEWPVPQNQEITVTLTKNLKTGLYENKDWFFTIEDVSSSGKMRPLAKARINIKDFAEDLAQQTLDLKLRPLEKKVKVATLTLTLSGQFVSRRLSDVSVVSKADIQYLELKAEETAGLFTVVKSDSREDKPLSEEVKIDQKSDEEEEQEQLINEEAKIDKNMFEVIRNAANEKYESFAEHIKTVVSEISDTPIKLIENNAINEIDQLKEDESKEQHTDNTLNASIDEKEEKSTFIKLPTSPKETNLDDEIKGLDQEELDIVEQIAILDNRLRESLDTDPMDYDCLLELRTSLVNRKNAVLQKQMQLNLLEKEAELETRYLIIQKHLQEFGEIDEKKKTEEDNKKEGLLMEELFQVVDQRNELLMQKHQQEQLIEEDELIEQRAEGCQMRNNKTTLLNQAKLHVYNTLK